MPTKPRREDRLICLFLSIYDDSTWNSCKICWLDQEQDGAVEVLATRASDGLTLAIEHTLIQPYGKYKRDLAEHDKFFSEIKKDQTLVARNRWIRVYVPPGTFKPGNDWNLIAGAVHEWLRGNVLALPEGEARPVVPIGGSSDCGLSIRVDEIPDFDGRLTVGTDGSLLPLDSLAIVVDKALATKVPKLAKTEAKRKILMLEYSGVALSEDRLAEEIERRRSSHPKLDEIHEIWFANTFAYEIADFVRFSQRRDGHPVKELVCRKGRRANAMVDSRHRGS